MASTLNLFLLMAFFTINMGFIAMAARPSPSSNNPNSPTLESRLKWNVEDTSMCWDSLLQLQACSAEVIMFFLNGETYLGHGCCEAIRTIEHECWPSMMGSLGFTAQEGDILEGYCDATAKNSLSSSSLSSSSSSSPPPTTTP